MHDTLIRLFRCKAWADDQLLDALVGLDDVTVTELAIKALTHSYVVDRIFAAHLRRSPRPYDAANLIEMPSLVELSADIRASDRDYLALVGGLNAEALAEPIDFIFTDGALGRMSREEILLHVITHGVGHRGQVSAVMLLKALPPATDGFTTYLHTAEAGDRRRAA